MPIIIVIPTPTETKRLYRRVVRKIKAMSAQEIFETLVRAGIYTEDGQLTEQYGGPKKRKIAKKKRRP